MKKINKIISNTITRQLQGKKIRFILVPLIRSPIILLIGRSSPSFPGAFNISLHSADLAQPGKPTLVINDQGSENTSVGIRRIGKIPANDPFQINITDKSAPNTYQI